MSPKYIRHELLLERDRELKPNVVKLCQEIHIHRTSYYDIINGKAGAKPEMLEKIASKLGLSLKDVVELEPTTF